jgi:hypothetical protein
MDEEMRLKIEQVVDSLVPDLKPEVARIEASLAATQNRYGDYGELLTSIAPSKSKAQIVALALIKAGANRQGVMSALQCFY